MAEKKYLDEVGLQTVANNVNTRLKTVTTMPSSATNGAVRLYVGNTGTYIKGHTYQYNSTSEEWNDITPTTDISSKADKVVSATNGDLAELDSNGNLTDSGILSSNVVVKSNTAGLLKNDGTVDTNTYATTTALEDKADKVASATENDIATLNSSGNLTDSGINSNIFPSGATSSNKLATANDIPTELNDLSDDVVITTPVNNQILAYNGTSGKWENKTGQIVIGSAVFKGSILFANLPTTGMENGDWYDIKDAFVTDSTFEEGSGIACAAGTDVIWVSTDNKWNILTPSGVYSFNGRTGAVVPASGDYTKSDVGLGNVVNTSDSSIPVSGGTTKFTTGGAYTELNKKTNKVNGSTNGDLAGLDGDGNLTDSGILGTDVIVKSNTAGLVKNDGTIDTSTYPNTFTGTQEQWNALTTAQKKEYEICNITDDIGTEVFYTKAESDATFATKVLSEPIEGATTVEGALGALSSNKVGWDVAGKSVKKNHANIFKALYSKAEYANYGFKNTSTDTRNDFRLRVQALDSSKTVISTRVEQTINATGEYSYDITVPANTAYIRIKHNGSSSDIVCDIPFTETGNFVISFNITGYNPSTANGLKVEYIMIRPATIADATFEPFIYDNTELEAKKADNSVIAPVENGAKASQQYTQGQHFLRNGGLYTVSATIAENEDIVENTNCVKEPYAIKDTLAASIADLMALVPAITDSAIAYIGSALVGTLTNNEITGVGGVIIISKVSATVHRWYGMCGNTYFAMGYITNGAYSIHRVVYKDTETAVATTTDTNITLDPDYKNVVKFGKVVNFKVRFVPTNDIPANPTSTYLFTLPFKPVLSYPYFAMRKRNDPYNEVAVGFIDNTYGRVYVKSALQGGIAYDFDGTFICQ